MFQQGGELHFHVLRGSLYHVFSSVPKTKIVRGRGGAPTGSLSFCGFGEVENDLPFRPALGLIRTPYGCVTSTLAETAVGVAAFLSAQVWLM